MTTQPPARPDVDPERDPAANPFDHDEGRYGQSYSEARERELGRAHPAGHPLAGDASATSTDEADDRDIPPDNGKRGWIEANGEVRGSGVGAGGGAEGEDFDDDAATGAYEPRPKSDGR